MGVLLTYGGLLLIAVGICSVAVPLKFLRIRTRWRGAAVAGAGLLIGVAGLLLPAPPVRRSERTPARIDDFMPEYQFSEFHERRVRATPKEIFDAVRTVTAEEIPLFGFLTGIRNPGRFFRRQPENILNPGATTPILEAATSSGFFVLAEEQGRELVVGTYLAWPAGGIRPSHADFPALSARGYLKAVLNFRVEDRPDGSCDLTTETRVLATDPATARRFAVYWRVIYPGSALIRRMWLLAIARRAEKAARASSDPPRFPRPRT